MADSTVALGRGAARDRRAPAGDARRGGLSRRTWPAGWRQFYERAGRGARRRERRRAGAVTLISAVSPPGGDFSEPVTQASLRVAGALWALDPALAHQRHFPAVDWETSYSRFTPRRIARLVRRARRRRLAGSRARALCAACSATRELRDIAGSSAPRRWRTPTGCCPWPARERCARSCSARAPSTPTTRTRRLEQDVPPGRAALDALYRAGSRALERGTVFAEARAWRRPRRGADGAPRLPPRASRGAGRRAIAARAAAVARPTRRRRRGRR